MRRDPYNVLAYNAKNELFPARKKRGEDTEKLGQFIDDLVALYKKHHMEGLTQHDSSHAMLELAMATMMRNGSAQEAVAFARFVRKGGEIAIRSINEHSSFLFEDGIDPDTPDTE